MNFLFDPLNLILLAIALIVFWRLKSVLGTRTGTERPPADVTVLRPRPNAPPTEEDEPPRGVQETVPARPVWHGVAPEGSEMAKALEAVQAKAPGFTVPQFLDGAKRAYEMILQAYAEADKAALKPLLGGDVMQSFSAAIDRRKAEAARFVFRFVAVNSATVKRVAIEGSTASLTVQFRSEMIQAVVGKDGEVTEGDDKAVREVEDVWTFERDMNSRDPNWKLVATDDDIG
jgi:predicted lipid-binding transport protein (Tim44 family)